MDEQNKNAVEVSGATETPKIEEVKNPETKKTFWSFFEKNFLAFSILVAGIMISSSLLYANGSLRMGAVDDGSGKPIVKKDVSADDDPVLGVKNAKVTIIEFSDYQCPFCRTWWKDSFNQLKSDYINTGKVRFIYRDYPLSFHAMAQASAEASECADDQGKYWEMHDKIFGEQDKKGQGTITFTNQDLKLWASQIGVDSAKFNQCLDSGKNKSEVEKDFADGSAAGVSGTPSFFINGRFVVGSQPYATFKTIIEEELKK